MQQIYNPSLSGGTAGSSVQNIIIHKVFPVYTYNVIKGTHLLDGQERDKEERNHHQVPVEQREEREGGDKENNTVRGTTKTFRTE